jgi:hypothetical protein
MFGIFDPYLGLIKIVVVLALVAGLFGAGYHQGSKSVRAEWDADKVVKLKLDLELSQVHAKEVTDLRAAQDKHNREVSNEHQDAINSLSADLAAARRAAVFAGGLRVSRSVCDSFGATTKAPGDSGHDVDVAGTVALPDKVTDGLFELVAEADRVTEVARSCQAWVKAQGFYGP